jgi:superfamily I DNA/RNA helicase
MNAKRLNKEYSCVFADEAQDFLPEEIALLRELGHRFFGVADSRQKIYKEQDSIAELESETNTVNLRYHYRNGKKICTVADGLAKAPTGEPSLVETSKYDEPKAPSSVEVICRSSLSAQCVELLARLDTQLKAYPGELIGVACPRGEDLADVITPLRSSPFSGLIVAQTSEEGYVPFEPAKDICVSKLHSAKGLEFRAFHILAAEGLKKFPMQRELTFMGVTRAKTSLCIYHSGDLPGYLEEAISMLKPKGAVLGLDGLLDSDDENEEGK